CLTPSITSGSRKRAATMSCGRAAQPIRVSSIWQHTGCRRSSSMRCLRRAGSTRTVRPRSSRRADLTGERQPQIKPPIGVDAGVTTGMDMQGKSVIVTGGASGIGKATALLLARGGARVFVGDVDEEGGEMTAAEAIAEQLAVEYYPLDLTDTVSITSFAASVHQ